MVIGLLSSIRKVTDVIPWGIKVIILVVGLFYYPLGILLTILDGIFHLTSSQKVLEKESPDWIVAKYFELKGLSKRIHEWMGILLLVSSVLMIWKMYITKEKDVEFYTVYMNVFYPMILFMISLAIVLKNIFIEKDKVSDEDNIAFF